MLLELDAFLAPPAIVLLKEQSSSQVSLEIWQANERNPAMKRAVTTVSRDLQIRSRSRVDQSINQIPAILTGISASRDHRSGKVCGSANPRKINTELHGAC